jgi:hypothetical protein
MGSLVFQATLGGQVNLNGPNTASTFDIAVPATTGTMVTTGDSGTVTNTMLAASAYNTPGTIGSGTANTGAFTTLSASSTVSGTGFSTYLASPPAIGGTAAAAGTFTTLSGTTSVTTPIVKSAGSLTLQTNGTTTAVTVDTSQNVGIGTSSLNNIRLSVDSGAANYSTSFIKGSGALPDNNDNAVLYVLNSGTAGTGLRVRTDQAITGSNFAHILVNNVSASINGLQVSQYGTGWIASFDKSGTVAMRIDSSGNVGIGTTSPGNRLDVRSSTASVARLQANGATSTSVFANSIVAIAANGSGADSTINFTDSVAYNSYIGAGSGSLYFATNGTTERMRIDSSGNLLVGTTSTSVTNGGYNFLINDGGTGYSTGYIGHITGTPSGYAYLNFKYAGTTVGTITQNGTTGVLYNLTSDYRLKDNPVALTGAKDFVMALQPKTWDWWDGSGKGVGFIAHEFMEVAKYSGHGEKDAVDKDNKPVYQSIQPSSSEVMANLVAFIQEQQALITSLTARIAALEVK